MRRPPPDRRTRKSWELRSYYAGVAGSIRHLAGVATRNGPPTNGASKVRIADVAPERVGVVAVPKRMVKIATVSHTLDAEIAERLRFFAFRERISESAVIEYALRVFFETGDDAALGTRLREAGAALRRKTS